MSIKLVVLYPQPLDPQSFEQAYHGLHMPLMRSLIAPADRLRTYRVCLPAGAAFYRMAEVDFPDLAELSAFAASKEGKGARLSSERVSNGGKPTVLICQDDQP